MTRTPTAWRISSFSSNGSNCVEVLELADGVRLRDSKDRLGPTLHLSAARWRAFLAEIVDDRSTADAAVRVVGTGDGGRRIEDTASAHALHFTAGEWSAFRRGVLAGEFEVPAPLGR